MTSDQMFYVVTTILAALGLWLMLPRGRAIGFSLGAVLVAIALGLYASRVPSVSGWVSQSVFFVLGAMTLGAAVGTVTSRNPVYCAIWFALSLLAASGLLMIQGAQFLGVATVVVYAGAILVTFLFVLMLAQPEGHAYYDRVSWEGHLAAISGAAMVGVLTLTTASVLSSPGVLAEAQRTADAAAAELPPAPPATAAAPSLTSDDPSPKLEKATDPPPPALPAVDPRLVQLRRGVLAEQHMAHLGGQLFSRHLVAVEVAGTLLMVALVAAVAIVAHGRGVETLTTELQIRNRRPAPTNGRA
ncbi:MAG: NADH-quinone oxidoreductase subunit J [Pirellulales bacterium]|nr:NADH-quinone oxidoreductase subunit J [Pirellulales bacterium]